MTYAELIKLLEPYADKKVFFNGYENRVNTEVHFEVNNDEVVIISRDWGKEEVEATIKKYD